jgi:hypothetical protein
MTFVSENTLIRSVWRKLEEPLAEILTHLIVTFCSMLSIELIEFIAHVFDWDKKPIPWTSTSLSDLLFFLEVLAAAAIILIGIIKAVIALVRT